MVSKIYKNKDTFARGKQLFMMPYKKLSILELSEVYAYTLYEYGRFSLQTNMVIDEFYARECYKLPYQ